MIDTTVLRNDEKAVFALRSLYRKYGYTQYKMSKFEEYDLYVRNKDFLVSENIITFNDTDGRLMALKPDVTLSIIKNTKDTTDYVQKVYYDENVYRVSKGTNAFKEIMQVGLECIGAVDDYCVFEVLMLAAESLNSISEDFVLDVSHLGVLSALIEELSLSRDAEKQLLACISEKNLHGIESICNKENADASKIKKLVGTYGSVEVVMPVLKTLCDNKEVENSVKQLENVLSMLKNFEIASKIRLDFSVINDTHYYNGIVFKGFINGIPTGILSGGQYDKLMQKMKRSTKAIGFAVYLDMLERLAENTESFDVDAVILYDESANTDTLYNAVKMLTDNGKRVMVQKSIPEKIRYKQLLKLQERGVEIVENNA